MNPLIECLGWTLVHFLWQGLAIALLLAVGLRWLRHNPPTQRYLAGCVALLLMVIAPVITSHFVAERLQSLPLPAVEPVTAAPNPVEIVPRPANSGPKLIVTVTPSVPRPVLSQRLETLLPWLVVGWCLGVLVLSCRLLAGWLQIKRLRRTAVETPVGPWRQKLAELARRLGVDRPLRLFQSAGVEVPTVIGWLRPVILLPVSCLTGLAPAQLESILAHELAHIRRHDYLVNLLQSVVETLLFYHPTVWWVSQRIREERENCCDDIAVKTYGDPVAYARALATLEELRLAPAQLALAAGGGSLLQRIQRLLGKSAGASSPPAWPLAGVVIVAMVLGMATGLRGNRMAAGDARVPETFRTDFGVYHYSDWNTFFELTVRSNDLRLDNTCGPSIHTSTGVGDWRAHNHWFVYLAKDMNVWAYDGGQELWLLTANPAKHRTVSLKWLEERPPAAVLNRLPQGVIKLLPPIQKQSSSFRSNEIRLATMVQEAKLLYEAGKLDEAEAKFNLVCKEDPANVAANQYLQWIKQTRKGDAIHRAEPGTNKIHLSKGRQAILFKLNDIWLDSVEFNNLPLSEVINQLSYQAKLRDPDRVGINFFIDRDSPAATAGNPNAIDPATGLPKGPLTNEVADISKVRVTIKPALTNVYMGDVLDAITKKADKPIKYSILDYAVVFSPAQEPARPAKDSHSGAQTQTITDGGSSVTLIGPSASSWTVSTNQPVGAATATFTVSATGTQPFSYQWSSNGTNIPGATTGASNAIVVTNPSFTVPATGNTRAAYYQWSYDASASNFVIEAFDTNGIGVGQMTASNIFVNGAAASAEARKLRDTQKTVLAPDEPEFLVQSYRLDMNALFKSARQANGAAHLEDQRTAEQAMQEYFDKAGIDFRAMNSGGPGNSCGYILGLKSGTLVVRAPKADLDKISKALAKLAPKLSVNIKASFIEIDEAAAKTAGLDWLFRDGQGNAVTNHGETLPTFAFPPLTDGKSNVLYNQKITNSIRLQNEGIVLFGPQFRAMTNVLLPLDGVSVLSVPQIVTESGRQAQIEVLEFTTVVFGTNATAGGKGTAGISYHTETVGLGPVLDIVPQASDDGHSINLKLIATVTEFLGYTKAKIPTPQLWKRELTTEASVLDGQTLVLGGAVPETVTTKDKVPVLGDLPLLDGLFRSKSSSIRKGLVVFITPTLIYPDGTPYHPGGKMTLQRTDVPPAATDPAAAKKTN